MDAKIASDVSDFYGKKVERTDRTDGMKLMFGDGSWVLARPSGTEPVVRFYAEASSRQELEHLIECGKRWTTEA